MNAVFKIMIFSILLNFAVGIMETTIVNNEGDSVFEMGNRAGLIYNPGYGNEFNRELNSTVNPSGVLEDKGNAIYRILDTLNLGFIAKIIEAVDKYMFGLVNMLRAMFGGALGDSSGFIFGIFKSIIGIGYILGAWYLWTGKSLDE